MYRRPDGRAVKKVKLPNGELKWFYSLEQNDTKAERDIQQQMLLYTQKIKHEKHNFKALAEKMLEYHEENIEYNTNECYKYAVKHLSSFFDYDIEEITPAMVQSLLNSMSKENYSFSSISKAKTVFGMITDYAIVQENLPLNNFTRSLKIPKRAKKGKILSPDDEIITKIINNAKTADFGLWAMCFLCTGLRRGELAALQRKDIDFENNLISVNKSVEFISNQPHLKNIPKSEDSIGDVPILEILRPHLELLCKDLKNNEFIFGKEKPLTKTQIYKRWKKYCDTIGSSFNGHQLRHAYAKLLYKAGIDPKTMQRLLRHADFSTTMNIYTEFSKEVTDKSIEKINDYINNSINKKI